MNICIKNLLYMNMDKAEIPCNCNGTENYSVHLNHEVIIDFLAIFFIQIL